MYVVRSTHSLCLRFHLSACHAASHHASPVVRCLHPLLHKPIIRVPCCKVTNPFQASNRAIMAPRMPCRSHDVPNSAFAPPNCPLPIQVGLITTITTTSVMHLGGAEAASRAPQRIKQALMSVDQERQGHQLLKTLTSQPLASALKLPVALGAHRCRPPISHSSANNAVHVRMAGTTNETASAQQTRQTASDPKHPTPAARTRARIAACAALPQLHFPCHRWLIVCG